MDSQVSPPSSENQKNGPIKGFVGKAGALGLGLVVIAVIAAGLWALHRPEAKSPAAPGGLASQDFQFKFDTALAELRIRQRRMQRLAETGQGNVALIGQAGAKLLQRQYAIMTNCYAAWGPVRNGHLLTMANVQEREELARRRAAVTNFAAAYRELGEFSAGFEADFRAEMEKSGVAMAPLEGAMQSVHTNMGALNGWMLQMATANTRWAAGELAALDLLATNWGKWSYDEEIKKLQFQDENQAEAFNRLVRDINGSRRDAERLKKQAPKYE